MISLSRYCNVNQGPAMYRNASLEDDRLNSTRRSVVPCASRRCHIASNVPSSASSWSFFLLRIYGGSYSPESLACNPSPPGFQRCYSIAQKLGSFPSRSWAIPPGLLLLPLLPLKMISDDQQRPKWVGNLEIFVLAFVQPCCLRLGSDRMRRRRPTSSLPHPLPL